MNLKKEVITGGESEGTGTTPHLKIVLCVCTDIPWTSPVIFFL